VEGVICARNEPKDRKKRKLKYLLEKLEMLDKTKPRTTKQCSDNASE
jgi:hypothetical protein